MRYAGLTGWDTRQFFRTYIVRGTQVYSVGETHPQPQLFGKSSSGPGRVQHGQIGKKTNESGAIEVCTREGSRHMQVKSKSTEGIRNCELA
jgi:hypothetical protein